LRVSLGRGVESATGPVALYHRQRASPLRYLGAGATEHRAPRQRTSDQMAGFTRFQNKDPASVC